MRLLSILLTFTCLGLTAVSSGRLCSLSVTENPRQVVGYTGKRVFYQCTVCGGTLYWEINGTFPHHYSGDPYFCETSEGNPGTLSIVALPSLNNVTLQCYAHYRGEEAVYSDPVLILVQGKLQAPTGLIPEINEQNISLSWVPPYTLPNTSMEFMVSVSVLGHSNSDILEVFSPNLTLFYYTLNISRVSNHTIEFTVWAVNPAGEGDSATIEVIIPVLDRRLPPETFQETTFYEVSNIMPETSTIVSGTIMSQSPPLENATTELFNSTPGIIIVVGTSGAGVLASLALLVVLFTSVTCCLLRRRKKIRAAVDNQKSSTYQMKTDGTATNPTAFQIASNSCYSTATKTPVYQMASNNCYSTVTKPPVYQMESNGCYDTAAGPHTDSMSCHSETQNGGPLYEELGIPLYEELGIPPTVSKTKLEVLS